MLRRLHPEQPDTFAFTPANQAWAEAQVKKYPEGRQASAIIPLLWRAQEQEGWLTRPAIEHVSAMLDLAFIRGLEVASFYFMFQLKPVGSVAHIQICGTTSCMICGAEDLIAVCKDKIAPKPHQLSADGKFSWEEVECLGACANAPMAQIGKDYYEDLTQVRMGEIIDLLAKGEVPTPGPQNGRFASEPLSGLTSLDGDNATPTASNASVTLATNIGDTVKRIDGTEVPLLTPWVHSTAETSDQTAQKSAPRAKPRPTEEANHPGGQAKAKPKPSPEPQAAKAKVAAPAPKPAATPDKAASKTADLVVAQDIGTKPATLDAARDGTPDDLKAIKGVGPKMEKLLHRLGFFHFDQIAAWSEDEVAWVDQNLEGFKGRVSRDEWVDQAKTLASGGETAFSSRVKKGGVY